MVVDAAYRLPPASSFQAPYSQAGCCSAILMRFLTRSLALSCTRSFSELRLRLMTSTVVMLLLMNVRPTTRRWERRFARSMGAKKAGLHALDAPAALSWLVLLKESRVIR